jgi:predicted metal-binding membrane protein
MTSNERPLKAVVVLVFALAAWSTVRLAGRMDCTMQMAGGQTMNTMWMHTPGDGWIKPGAAFAAMWGVMMLAMMLPSAWPGISSFRQVALSRGEPWPGALSLVMLAGYFFVWQAFGMLAYAAGLALSEACMTSPWVSHDLPIAAAFGLVIAGLYQLTPWKLEFLGHCRDPLHFVAFRPGGGWRQAVRLGVVQGWLCVSCCWGLMLMQLLLGMATVPLIVGIAIVIAAEKLLPEPAIIARGIGLASVVIGVVLAVRVGIP